MEKSLRDIDMSVSPCENCALSVSCKNLQPCQKFALAVGTNFNAELELASKSIAIESYLYSTT
jgi:hypothetical protein